MHSRQAAHVYILAGSFLSIDRQRLFRADGCVVKEETGRDKPELTQALADVNKHSSSKRVPAHCPLIREAIPDKPHGEGQKDGDVASSLNRYLRVESEGLDGLVRRRGQRGSGAHTVSMVKTTVGEMAMILAAIG